MIGQTVSHYRIVEKLGAGGMGEVFLALDTELNRQVALKFLPAALSNDPEVRTRFKREAQALAALNHPHIVTVHSVAEHEGRPFIVMEHISGKSLREISAQSKLPLEQVADWALQLAEGLAAAHQSGIVHRDIKSENILVSSTTHVKILDFGLAMRQDASRVTRDGSTLGTAAYMSPEQAAGSEVDRRSDLFSLGVVLYELTTRQLPFQGEHEAAVAYAVMHEEPAPLARFAAQVPDEWQRIVSKCLAKDPGERYQSATDLAADLKALQRRRSGIAPGAKPASEDMPSIAVLPFANMSADPENEFFSDGLSEELLNVLARNPGLKVTGRTSCFAFKGKQQDLREIGQKLGVETLLEGSVRKSGNRVRITAQLVKASDGFHLWSNTYDRVLEDVFAVQDEIAGHVAGALNVALLGKKRAQVSRNPEVYSLILQGNHLGNRNTEDSLRGAERAFERALQLDPEAAEAWAGLAHVFILLAQFGHADTKATTERAKQSALRAVQLDDQCMRGHIQLSRLYMTYDYDWARARHECDLAEEIAPGDSQILYARAGFHIALDHPAKSLPIIQRAIELDPLNPIYLFRSSRFHWFAGDPVTGATQLRNVLALSPGFASAHANLAVTLLETGHPEAALQEARLEPEGGYMHWGLAIVLHGLGRRTESATELQRLENLGPSWAVQTAQAKAFCGDLDSAFQWLGIALEERDPGLCWIRHHPCLSNVRSDPRWPQFLKKMDLPV